MDEVFKRLTVWFAPVMVFTCEEAWEQRYPGMGSVHLQLFPETPAVWLDAGHAARWAAILDVRKDVTGALEIERREKRIGSSLEADVTVLVPGEAVAGLFSGEDPAEIFITSAARLVTEIPGATADATDPERPFTLVDPGSGAISRGFTGAIVTAIFTARASGVKCARSWKYFDPATADPAYPDITPRDAAAVREYRGV